MKCKDCGDVSCTRRRSENSECFFEEDLRKQKELEEMPNWEHFRAEVARDILCSMIQDGYYGEDIIVHQSELAVGYANELVKQLKEKEEG